MWEGPAGCGHKLAGAHQQQGRLSVHASQHCFQCACITTLLSMCMHHNIDFSVHASQHNIAFSMHASHCLMGIRVSVCMHQALCVHASQHCLMGIRVSVCMHQAHASQHCLMGIRVYVTLPHDLLCMCILCLAWRISRQVFCPQFDCQTSHGCI